MDSLARRILARFQDSMVQRIEAIPNWQRSNFLVSVHQQIQRGRTLSPKQVAVIEKIEGQSNARLPSNAIIIKGPMSGDAVRKLAKELIVKGSAKVHDPENLLETDETLRKILIRELASPFWGQAETYAEMNADEDDPGVYRRNLQTQRAYEQKATKMERAKIIVRDGVVTTDPDFRSLMKSIR